MASEELIRLQEISDILDQEIEASKCSFEMFLSMKLPAWIKIYNRELDQFRMLVVNEIYEQEFGLMNTVYGGQLDKDVWEETVSAGFEDNDRKALTSRGKPIKFKENLINPKDHKQQVCYGFKWGPHISKLRGNVVPVFGIITALIDVHG